MGDICDPELIWPLRCEVAIDEVWRGPAVLSSLGRFPFLAPRDTHDASVPHQPRDTLFAHQSPFSSEQSVNSWGTIDPLALEMENPDPLGEQVILFLSQALISLEPGVVARPREPQKPRHDRDAVFGLVRSHERVPRLRVDTLSEANQAAAFFRMSRSSRSRSFSALSFLIS